MVQCVWFVRGKVTLPKKRNNIAMTHGTCRLLFDFRNIAPSSDDLALWASAEAIEEELRDTQFERDQEEADIHTDNPQQGCAERMEEKDANQLCVLIPYPPPLAPLLPPQTQAFHPGLDIYKDTDKDKDKN